CGQGTNDPFTF
nr:immunoglobulin light chain junction region [Macaca mulatta]MOV76140.1 immunoglobulin light chain junction region [Macaca mulatta]MOV76758.1 immunoglobulin light chain junction region [Macaca mulatta]